MEKKELIYWLWWNRIPGIGSSRFFKLYKEFGSMNEAWHAPLGDLKTILGEKAFTEWKKIMREWDPEKELSKIENHGFRVYCSPDSEYPALLKQIPDPPPVIYVWGGFEYGDDIAVAIVGTRNPSPLGSYHARELASQLSSQGLTIVSGMARGIDSEAHQGALEAKGRTIAVLGCGLDNVYPPENELLMKQIAGSGAVISEFPLGTEPLAKNFPARNRIISGLSLGVIVVEAAQDSGSLITAGFAVEQGREVFAVPGNIGNDGSKGPHKLIRQGAKLVEDYQDILSELAIPHLTNKELTDIPPLNLNENEVKIIRILSREPQHIDLVSRNSGLPAAQVNSLLMQLELKGNVKRYPGQLYIRIK